MISRISFWMNLKNCYGGKDTMLIEYDAYSKTAEKFNVSVKRVSNIWKEHCCGTSTHNRRSRPKKLSNQDIDFIEYMKMQRPSYTSPKNHAELVSVSTTEVGPRTIRREVQKHLSKPYSLKKINTVAEERFTYDGLHGKFYGST